MAAVELPLSLNSPNSLYRQTDSLYRQSGSPSIRQSGAAEKLFGRQKSVSVVSASTSAAAAAAVAFSASLSTPGSASDLLSLTEQSQHHHHQLQQHQQQQRQISSISVSPLSSSSSSSPFCGLAGLQAQASLTPTGLKRTHLAVEGSSISSLLSGISVIKKCSG